MLLKTQNWPQPLGEGGTMRRTRWCWSFWKEEWFCVRKGPEKHRARLRIIWRGWGSLYFPYVHGKLFLFSTDLKTNKKPSSNKLKGCKEKMYICKYLNGNYKSSLEKRDPFFLKNIQHLSYLSCRLQIGKVFSLSKVLAKLCAENFLLFIFWSFPLKLCWFVLSFWLWFYF